MTASTSNLKALTYVAAMVNDCFEVVEEDFNPLDKVFTEVEELETFVNELKINAIVSFLKIYC